jgi:hypothetical protein
MRRFAWTIAAFSLLAVALVAGTPAASENFPARIDFPAGWRAEGIATGQGHTFFAPDSSNGALYRGDYRTGQGEIIRAGVTGQTALGIFADSQTGSSSPAAGPAPPASTTPTPAPRSRPIRSERSRAW